MKAQPKLDATAEDYNNVFSLYRPELKNSYFLFDHLTKATLSP
jgi:hypothetical protein